MVLNNHILEPLEVGFFAQKKKAGPRRERKKRDKPSRMWVVLYYKGAVGVIRKFLIFKE